MWVANIMAYTGIQYTQNFSDSPFWGNRPVLEWHVYYKDLDEEIDDVCISTSRLLRFFLEEAACTII